MENRKTSLLKSGCNVVLELIIDNVWFSQKYCLSQVKHFLSVFWLF